MSESFGARLRRLREAAGLSQEDLAERAGLSSHAVSALERGTRTRPYPHTVRALADALEVSDEERTALVAALPARRSTASRSQPAAAARGSLPTPTTDLLGRERDLERIARLLREHRVVTLTGTGGVGKTRLATALAERLRDHVEHGVAWVELAPLGDPGSVLPTIAEALGATNPADPLAAVREQVGQQRLLLVLDNVEHVIGAAPDVAALLASLPGVTLLATSRAPLRIRGEVEVVVEPLPEPEAVRLLLERAGETTRGWGGDPGDAEAVAGISRALAGIPLALELAAARSRVLGPRELHDRLDQALLAGGRDLPARQRTMRATLDWSYGLLTEEERALLRLLSVFTGSFRLDDVEAVAAATLPLDNDVLCILEALVEQSLVISEAGADGRRHRMLEPIAQYADSRLREAGEWEAASSAHASHFLRLVERLAPEFQRAGQVEALARIDADHANVTAAIERRTQAGDGESVARFGWALWMYWWLRGHSVHGRRLVEPALVHELSPAARVGADLAAATMCFAMDDLEAARSHWVDAVTHAVDPLSRANSVAGVGLVDLAVGDERSAGQRFEEAIGHASEAGGVADWIFALSHIWLGTVALVQGDADRAVRQTSVGLESARRRGDRLTAYIALYNLCQVELLRGSHDRARAHLDESLRLSSETGDLGNVAFVLDALAVLEEATGRHARVPLLLGAAQTIREGLATHYGYYRPDPEAVDRAAASAREHLGRDRYDDALDVGLRCSPDEAAALGISRTQADGTPA